MSFNKEQSLVYYSKTDLLYNLVDIVDGIAELHLNCPHIDSEQIIFVSENDIDWVMDINDTFDPVDYGFQPLHVYKSETSEWIEDWELKGEIECSIYLNGTLNYVIYRHNYGKKNLIYFGRIPSKADGNIIMKNLGFKRI